MKTIIIPEQTITVYEFSELSEKAQENALNDQYAFECQMEFCWNKDYEKTMREYCDLFRVSVNNWSVDIYHGYSFRMTWDGDEMSVNDIVESIDENGLTGFSADFDIISYISENASKAKDSTELLHGAFSAFFEAWKSDMEYTLSRDAIIDSININEYTFLESGEMRNA